MKIIFKNAEKRAETMIEQSNPYGYIELCSQLRLAKRNYKGQEFFILWDKNNNLITNNARIKELLKTILINEVNCN